MALSNEEIAHARDLFDALGDLTTRKMFGGLGIYHRGVIFAVMLSDGRIMLKGQGEMQDRFDALGMERWTSVRPGKSPTAMPYWTLPDSAQDDAEEAVALARAALACL